MKRRDFIAFAGGVASAWPLWSRAQQAERVRRIGMLIARAESDAEGQAYVTALRQALEKLGWRLGRNVEIETRWQAGSTGQAQAFARELVASRPDLLVVNSTPYLRAAGQVAGEIPIVFVAIADPVGQGFVASLARPGGTMTGFGVEDASLGAKWLELLKEMAPRIARATAIFNPETSPNAQMFLSAMAAVGASLAVEQIAAPVRTEGEIEHTIAKAQNRQRGGLIVLPDNFLYTRRQMIVALAARHAIPAIYYHTEFARAGGLIAYGIDRVDLFRRAAHPVDRILRGAKPADLPVEMPSKFELVVNHRTAKALGLAIPPSVLTRADEVIE